MEDENSFILVIVFLLIYAGLTGHDGGGCSAGLERAHACDTPNYEVERRRAERW